MTNLGEVAGNVDLPGDAMTIRRGSSVGVNSSQTLNSTFTTVAGLSLIWPAGYGGKWKIESFFDFQWTDSAIDNKDNCRFEGRMLLSSAFQVGTLATMYGATGMNLRRTTSGLYYLDASAGGAFTLVLQARAIRDSGSAIAAARAVLFPTNTWLMAEEVG